MKNIIKQIMQWVENSKDADWFLEALPLTLIISSLVISAIFLALTTNWYWMILIPIGTLIYLYYKWDDNL
mgnify:CR=1 FL=1